MAGSSVSEGRTESWSSYTAFLAALARVDAHFEWLRVFLGHAPPQGSYGGRLIVLQSENGQLTEHTSAIEDLNHPPHFGSTRLIILSYEEVWSINRELLDHVTLSLNLPPFLFLQHFLYWDKSEAAFPGYPRDYEDGIPPIAVSETSSLEIGWARLLHMSAMIVKAASGTEGTIILALVRNRGLNLRASPPSRVLGPASLIPSSIIAKTQRSDELWQSLDNLSPTAIRSADKTPHEYFCPWIDSVQQSISTDVARIEQYLNPFLRTADCDEESLERNISDIEMNSSVVERIILNLDAYFSLHAQSRTPAIEMALKDLEMLRNNLDWLQRRAQALQGRLVATLAIQESRKSIEQSISTKRLAQLAYLFLPLSLGTSVFGMNVVELQNSELSVFMLVASVLLAANLLLWFALGWLLHPETIANTLGIGKAIVILVRFFCRAPRHGSFLILFALCQLNNNDKNCSSTLGTWDNLMGPNGSKFAGFDQSFVEATVPVVAILVSQGS
ncbi:MAG: hypothetical protein ASARMPRED_005339 [Alectoria sarmentosa]|nr:MAG: hypothetical protein ASARMPRED_005339 [Alectoria sarmentosa]